MIRQKRAQLGKIITTFPVAIIIILIMAVFIVSASLISLFNIPLLPTTITLGENSLLLQKVSVANQKSVSQETLVIDAVKQRIENKMAGQELGESLLPLITKEDECAIILTDENAAAAYYKNGKAYALYYPTFSQLKNALETFSLMINPNTNPRTERFTINVNGKDHDILAYKGDCKHE
ncbi:MAG: hypothetical protein Q7S74_01755 [Nanoarchaeota archaeon]|nr:hypothetical protein [Nanoarchaeota archaeon]